MTTPFSPEGCVAVVRGGNGALGSALAKGLGSAGAAVGVLARSPNRVAAAVGLWLCSPASRFVTGAVVPVDGGFGSFGGV